MSDLHLRISWALASGTTSATPGSAELSAEGSDTLDTHPVFVAAVERLVRRTPTTPRPPSAAIRVLPVIPPIDPGFDDCA